jgi:hypothetical protein
MGYACQALSRVLSRLVGCFSFSYILTTGYRLLTPHSMPRVYPVKFAYGDYFTGAPFSMPWALRPEPYTLRLSSIRNSKSQIALCPMLYALCPMPYALCQIPNPTSHIPHLTSQIALRPAPYALCLKHSLGPTTASDKHLSRHKTISMVQ